MLPNIWCSSVFLLSILAVGVKGTGNLSDVIVSDVIKNISRVNTILQELISNYEMLQNIYKSQEAFDFTILPTIGSDDNKVSKKDERFPATKLHYSEMDNSEYDESAEKNGDTENKGNVSLKYLTIKPKTRSTKHIPELRYKVVGDAKEDFDSHNVNDSYKNIDKKRLDRDHVPRTANTTIRMETMYIISDKNNNYYTNKSSRQKVKHIGNINRETNLRSHVADKPHTHNEKHQSVSKVNQSSEVDRNEKTTKKLKSIKKDDKSEEITNQADSIDKEDKHNGSAESEEDMALTKDLFKTSILRTAYGDACLKLVIRKCYTACKNTLKSVCLTTKCKSPFKSQFSKCYKKKCDSLFADMVYRRISNVDNVDDDYVTAVCKPIYRALVREPIKGEIAPKSNNNVTETTPINPLHMLREKYEKACIKTSRKKCKDACMFAYTKACEKNECKKDTKKKFEKACKRHCDITFFFDKNKHKSSGSSDSDKSSNSDSSGSDSD